MHTKESLHLACCGSGDYSVLWSAVKWLIFVSDPDPCLHNTLSCRDVGTKYPALVPGETSLVVKHSIRLLYRALVSGFGNPVLVTDFTRLWYQTLVTDLGTRLWCRGFSTRFCVCVCMYVILILDLADVMPAGCPWRETDGIWLWSCRKYETLQPGKNNLAWADPWTMPSETLTLRVCPVLRPHLLSITSRTWRFPLLYSRGDGIHWQTPKTLLSSLLRWVLYLQKVQIGLQYWPSSYSTPIHPLFFFVHLYARRCLTWSSISTLNTGSMWTLSGVLMPQMWCFPTYWSCWKSTARGCWATFCRQVCISNTTSTVHRFSGEVSSQGFNDFIPKRKKKLIVCLTANLQFFCDFKSSIWATVSHRIPSVCQMTPSLSLEHFKTWLYASVFCYRGEVSFLSTSFIGTAKYEYKFC